MEEEIKPQFDGVKQIDNKTYQYKNSFITKNGRGWRELKEWIDNGGAVDNAPYEAYLLTQKKKRS